MSRPRSDWRLRQLRWVERRRLLRRIPPLRWLEQIFVLRLLLAIVLAMAALALVNRWEHCRNQSLAPACLLRDAGGIVTVANLEALSILTASILFVLEGGRRRQRQHVEAMELITSRQQAGVRLSYARNDALELLSHAGIDLDGLDLRGVTLDDLQVPGARWHGVQLRGASLQRANLRHSDLRGANLQDADFRAADLRGADLRGANLQGTRLDGARLQDALFDGPSGDVTDSSL